MRSDLTAYDPPPGKLHYPVNGMIGIVDVDQAPALIDALKADNVTDDSIDVITSERRDDFDLQLEGGGVLGTIKRLVADSGGDLDLLKAVRDDLQPGRMLVVVRISGDVDARERTAEIFWRFNASHVNHLSHFLIERMQRMPPADGNSSST